ncbi:hypothetical protein C8R45DRAFT_382302 [Mycena sanguinolenta]|nr:hypothetical protein C8R45DRAFT_382302 [Mycena sanguinolenta]
MALPDALSRLVSCRPNLPVLYSHTCADACPRALDADTARLTSGHYGGAVHAHPELHPCSSHSPSAMASVFALHLHLSPRAPRALCGMRPHRRRAAALRRRLLETAETFLPLRLRFSAGAMTETRSTQASRPCDRRGGRLVRAAGRRGESDYA